MGTTIPSNGTLCPFNGPFNLPIIHNKSSLGVVTEDPSQSVVIPSDAIADAHRLGGFFTNQISKVVSIITHAKTVCAFTFSVLTVYAV